MADPLQIIGEGILVGFAVAAPVGPVAVVSIERTLSQGLSAGLAVGLGAAVADTILGAVAGFGLTVLSDVIEQNHGTLRFIGGIILIVLGIVLIASRAKTKRRAITAADLLHAFTSAFAITITNPDHDIRLPGDLCRPGLYRGGGHGRAWRHCWSVASSWEPASGGCLSRAWSPCVATGSRSALWCSSRAVPAI